MVKKKSLNEAKNNFAKNVIENHQKMHDIINNAIDTLNNTDDVKTENYDKLNEINNNLNDLAKDDNKDDAESEFNPSDKAKNDLDKIETIKK